MRVVNLTEKDISNIPDVYKSDKKENSDTKRDKNEFIHTVYEFKVDNEKLEKNLNSFRHFFIHNLILP